MRRLAYSETTLAQLQQAQRNADEGDDQRLERRLLLHDSVWGRNVRDGEDEQKGQQACEDHRRLESVAHGLILYQIRGSPAT